jgi:hypothetical protein
MWRVVRRLLVVVIFGAATMAALRAVRASRPAGPGPGRDESGSGADVSWPPLDEPAPTPVVAAVPPPVSDRTWCEPVGTSCPDGFPVKVGSSGIYHVPGGQFYARTIPARCYATTAAAEADGYRAAKR